MPDAKSTIGSVLGRRHADQLHDFINTIEIPGFEQYSMQMDRLENLAGAATLNGLQTEDRNPRSANIDAVTTEQLCRIINEEDSTVAYEVEKCVPAIAHAIDLFAERLRLGGRVIYIGAGTSGRLGVLDASEIPPTYSAPPEQFVGIIAGGDEALRSAIEGAEDSTSAAVRDLQVLQLDGDRDCLVGIAASGRTPYVLSGLSYAKAQGCVTLGIACAKPSVMSGAGCVDAMIEIVTGPEVVTGSTRMKAGTATKLVLNMLSTGIMVKMGKTYGNIMVDVKSSNAKLRRRARRILREICGSKCPAIDDELDSIITSCDRNLKLAAIVISLGTSREDAVKLLEDAGGILSKALPMGNPAMPVTAGFQENVMRKFYLCVDGGGSETSVAIASNGNLVGSSQVGPCNITEMGLHAATSQIMKGIDRAMFSCETALRTDLLRTGFAGAWIAVAGLNRAGIKGTLLETMRQIVRLGIGAQLQVTNDIELLVAVDSNFKRSRATVVLVAGTGSVAMAFRQSDNAVECVGRTGGWGPLLGDDGSGFSIGRQAIRHSLQELESSSASDMISSEVDDLTKTVLEFYQVTGRKLSTDLLDTLLSPSKSQSERSFNAKSTIAGCAKSIIDASVRCVEAASIVASAQDSLIGLVRVLLRKSHVDANGALLILAGGLTKSHSFSSGLQERLISANIHFQEVVHNHSPAWSGALHLAEKGV